MPHSAFSPDAVAVVTGGASGIGLAAAVRFARMALRVCIADLGEDRLAGAADALAAAAPRGAPMSWGAVEERLVQPGSQHGDDDIDAQWRNEPRLQGRGELRQRGEQKRQYGGECLGQPLQIHRRGGEKRLDAHVWESPPDGPGQPVPGLGLAVKAFRAPAMALVETDVIFRPALLSTAGPQQRGVIIAHHHGLVDAPG